MSIVDNLFIGRELKKYGLLDRSNMVLQAKQMMKSYGFDIDVSLPLNQYSVAMQQIVAIARAVSLSAKILILDEPTASLDSHEVEMLFTIMRRLKSQGMGLVFITHFLDQVYQVSDRITVLRNGELVGTKMTAELSQ
ncbi:ATP-binding cassette domain-containing protein, partial [Vibrio anguillarum]